MEAGIYNMNVITVFRDPGWSLDVVTRTANMKWTKPLLDMIKQADVIEDGKYVLSINRNGDKPSDALKQLRDKLVANGGVSL